MGAPQDRGLWRRFVSGLRSLFGAIGRTEAHRRQSEITALIRRLDDEPEDDRALLRLGDLYLSAGDGPRALSAYWHAAEIHDKRGRRAKAAAILKRIVTLTPHDTNARRRLGVTFGKLERKREAALQFEQAGWIHKARGETEAAVECFRQSIALDASQRHVALELQRLAPPKTPIPRIVPFASPDQAPRHIPIPGDDFESAQRPRVAVTTGRRDPRAAGCGLEGEAATDPDCRFGAATIADSALTPEELGITHAASATVEYGANDLATLLDADDFEAQTVWSEDLPEFDDEHRPRDTLDPIAV